MKGFKTITRFEFILDPSLASSPNLENTIIDETQSFAVIPSLGSLVPGWLLIIPKRRILNCAMLTENERSELKGLIDRLALALRCFRGRVFVFEHGSTQQGSLIGCGVDQAHLHIVPLEFNLLEVASKADGVLWGANTQGNVLEFIKGRDDEYVAIHEYSSNRNIIGRPLNQTSQWVRKVIAAKLDHADEWDYRNTSKQDVIAATITALKSLPLIRV
jgi:diadenosine tetraphosphate (Ap4A) HIT family hydrolase